MIFINNSGLVGDTLATFPVLEALSKLDEVWAAMMRVDLLELLRNRNSRVHNIWDCEVLQQAVRVTSAGRAFNYCTALHMTQAHFKVLGLPVPERPIPPPIQLNEEETPAFDYLIAPYSRSNYQNNKAWPIDRWQKVINHFKAKGKSLSVLRSSHDTDPVLEGCDIAFDKPINAVGNAMRQAGLVVTLDSGMGHLAAAVGAHYKLLCGNAIPLGWVSYSPETLGLYGRPLDWTIEEVISVMEQASA